VNDDVEPTGPPRSSREPTELIVAPTRIGGGRRWSQPGIVVAIVVTAFVGVSVWKPWDGGSSGATPSPRTSAPIASEPAGVAGASETPFGHGGPLPNPNPFATFPSKATLLQATDRDPRWGIRAVVVRDGPPAYTGEPAVVERWVAADVGVVTEPARPSPLPPSTSAPGPPPAALTVSQPTDEVAAIGLTTADDALALDVRIWRISTDEGPELLAPLGIVGPEAGSWLWLPDKRHATTDGMWPAGTYLIEALLGPRIVTLAATIPASQPVAIQSSAPIVDQEIGSALAPLDPGLVVLADGRAANVIIGAGPAPGNEQQAWLGAAGGFPGVGRVASLDVRGFAWIAHPGEILGSLDVRPLSLPGSELSITSELLGTVDRPAIVTTPTFPPLFPTGAYAITAALDGPAGPRTETEMVEIVPPGLQSPPLSPLGAMSRWVGLLDHPDRGAPQALVFIADPGASTDQCAAETRITGSDTSIGIVLPPGVTLGRLRMLPADVNQSADIAIRYAPDAIPRLTVVALPSAGLPTRDYDVFLTLESAAGEARIAQRICVSGV
jgi:hypothetical protein